MDLLSKLSWLLDTLLSSDDQELNIDEVVKIDDVELEQRQCRAELELLEQEFERIEEEFENLLDRAPSAENPERYYRKALSLLDDFEQKQSEYESVAEEYVMLSTLVTVAEQYEDLTLTTFDTSDEMSDRQREVVQKLRQDQRVQEISSVLDRQIDDSEIPDEYRSDTDEIGYDFTDDSMYHDDGQRYGLEMAWFDQITDEILPDDTTEDTEYWTLQEE